MDQIMVVEDDRKMNAGLCKALKSDSCTVTGYFSLSAAREQLALGGVSLVLLDVALPDGSGLDFLREIKREKPSLPVVLLTANDTDMDIVDGLEQGADDYITKPFSLAVLRARVNTQLRKTAHMPSKERFRNERFVFDFTEMRFLADGMGVELSKTEQRLLRLLVENRGSTMSRSSLMEKIWTDGAEYVDENALSVTVKRLRDKLGAHKEIQTVYGIGYRWVKENDK